MSEYKVNGKATRRPAGYDSFDYSKKTKTRNTQLLHGEGKEGFKAPQHAKITIDGIFKAIYAWKEQGKPLENVARIKVHSNKELEKSNGKDEGMTH